MDLPFSWATDRENYITFSSCLNGMSDKIQKLEIYDILIKTKKIEIQGKRIFRCPST